MTRHLDLGSNKYEYCQAIAIYYLSSQKVDTQ